MKELGITKGEWKATGKSVDISGEKMRRVSGPEGQSVHSMELNQLRRESDAKLIADAGTTANKCNLLPSELLERYKEAIEALNWFIDFPEEDLKGWIEEGKPVTITAPSKAFELALQTISKSNRE